MEMLNRLSAVQRNLLIAVLPTLGMLLFMSTGWDHVKAGLIAEGASTSSILFFPFLFVLAGFAIAFLTASGAGGSSERLERALETCQANVMIADKDFNIQYMNESVVQMLRDNEVKLREAIPAFLSIV